MKHCSLQIGSFADGNTHIASNDGHEDPFDILLRGVTLSFAEDGDGDGLNDAPEFLLSSLGFNFQVSQPSLVNTLFSHLGGAVSNFQRARQRSVLPLGIAIGGHVNL